MTTSSNERKEPPPPPPKEPQQQEETQQQEQEQLEETNYGQRPEYAALALEKYGIVLDETRCQDKDGFVGTIVYVGPVASASSSTQLYAGIVWDDVTRGKHNGSVISKRTHQLVSHFSCCRHPTGASFVKLEKVDFGRPLTLHVIQQRYVELNNPELVAPNNLLPHVVGRAQKPVEFYGELQIRKRQQIGDLKHMALRRHGICRVEKTDLQQWTLSSPSSSYDKEGESTSTKETIPVTRTVQKLDLAGNLLATWKDVANVLFIFDALQDLSLASNRIRDFTDPDMLLPPKTILLHLNLRHCQISNSNTILNLAQVFPQLEELCLSGNPIHLNNKIGNGDDDESNTPETSQQSTLAKQLALGFPCLKQLDVSECNLQHDCFAVFSLLPKLTWLSLDDNPLEKITRRPRPRPQQPPQRPPQRVLNGGSNNDDDDDDDSVYFPALEQLQVSGTQISRWMDCDGLMDLTHVTWLRFRSNPLTAEYGSAANIRSHLIARYPNLKMINSTPISDHERRDAERRYVGTIAKQLAAMNSASTMDPHEQEEFLNNHHPRYQELAHQHATAAAAAAHGGGHGSSLLLSDTLVSLTLRSMAAQSCEKTPLIRRLPCTLTVGKIKALLSRQFGLDVDLQQLTVVIASGGSNDNNNTIATNHNGIPTVLDDDDRDLAYYGVLDGSTIYMHELEFPTPSHNNNNNEDEEHAQFMNRVDQQESEIYDFMARQKTLTKN